MNVLQMNFTQDMQMTHCLTVQQSTGSASVSVNSVCLQTGKEPGGEASHLSSADLEKTCNASFAFKNVYVTIKPLSHAIWECSKDD